MPTADTLSPASTGPLPTTDTRSPGSTGQETIEVSFVMPCLNESATLARCIEKARRAIQLHGLRAEIIVADNGSTDDSVQIATACGARVVAVGERGYGSALTGGIAAARGDFVIMGDADDSYDWFAVYAFVERLRAGADVVIGTRLPAGGGTIMPGAMPWKNRWIGNPVLTSLGRLFFRAPVSDFHCGFRAFRKAAYDAMALRTTGMEFASEMVVKATLKGQRISEVPITLYPDGRGRPPHLRRWRDGWRHLRFMLLFCPRWLFLIPGIALCAIGAIGGGALMLSPIYIGAVRLSFNTQLACSMALLAGFQLVTFAVFTNVFAAAEGLLPGESRLRQVMDHPLTLEIGLASGLFLVALGLWLFLLAINYWRRVSFGALPYDEGVRFVIPAVTLVTLGVQIFFSSFFLSALSLHRK